jgi:hypothetical protein
MAVCLKYIDDKTTPVSGQTHAAAASANLAQHF